MSLYLLLILCAIVILIGAGSLNIYIYKWNKSRRGGSNRKLVWYYNFRKYEIPIPPAHLSTYYLKSHRSELSSLRFFGTIDDPVLLQIAEDFNDLFPRKSESFKAHCLQAMIQQNVSYISDKSRFGVDNQWCFPIKTLTSKCGDCEDSAILYAGLAQCIGLTVYLQYSNKHMFCTVYISEDDSRNIELTGYIPTSSFKKYTGISTTFLCKPSDTFLRTLERY